MANEFEFGFKERHHVYDYMNDVPNALGEPSWLEDEIKCYFFAGAGILILTSALVIVDVDWIPMSTIQITYCIIQSVHIWYRFRPIFIDYVVAVIIGQPIVYASNY